MVSFERTKLPDWGIINASKEEWDAIKDLIAHVAQPEIFGGSGLDIMSGMEYEDWLSWNMKFSEDRYKDVPPQIIHRSELHVIFMTACNAIDAKVQGLTEEHWGIIGEINKHKMSEAVECGQEDSGQY
ncbi:MAG: hypothetical protein OEY94_00400 [Alphaproteobacteria bacterium]|nr:hypothetical protein [Alphaproteobacteria bacterium]